MLSSFVRRTDPLNIFAPLATGNDQGITWLNETNDAAKITNIYKLCKANICNNHLSVS